MGYFSKNRYKYYLKCHLIFVCKYRKQLITDEVRGYILNVFKSIEEQSDFDIEVMKTGKDHIHMLISYPPNISISSIVRRLKTIQYIIIMETIPYYAYQTILERTYVLEQRIFCLFNW